MNIYHDVLPSVVTPRLTEEALDRLKMPIHFPGGTEGWVYTSLK
jgi:hypothetical protein